MKEIILYQLLFWAYLLAFSFMLAAFGLGLATHQKRLFPVPKTHLIYLAFYAVWLLCSVYLFLQAVNPTLSARALFVAVTASRLFVALFLLYVGPLSALRFARVEIGRRQWWLLLIPVAFVSGAAFVFYATGSPRVALVPNGIFNAYLALLFLFAAHRTSGSAFRTFLWASAAGYVFLLVLNVLTIAGFSWKPSALLFAAAVAFVCLLWGAVAIVILLRLWIVPPASHVIPVAEGSGDTLEYRLRKAVEADQARIRQMVRDAGINPFGLRWPNFVVAETLDRGIVGCGQLKPHAGRLVELASLVVEPNSRGKGVGRSIIERLLFDAPRPLYLMCLPHLAELYARFGFVSAETRSLPSYFRRIERLSRFIRLFSRSHAPVVMYLESVDRRTTSTQYDRQRDWRVKKTMTIDLFQIDAFTSKLFAGNPAAVCFLDAWLEDSVLRDIAAENNLSETAFLVPTGGGGADYELRWFTPEVEVDLCGHATLASAHALFAHRDHAGSRVVFETKSGRLTVERTNDLLVMDFPARPAEVCEPSREVEEVLGLRPQATLRARDLMVVVETEEEIRNLRPDLSLLGKLPEFALIVTAPGRESDFVSRFFAPGAGIPEDPVTGSAHCTLVPYWAHRLGKRKLHAYQLSRRGGELFCEDKGERTAISGRAVTYLTGTIAV